MSIVSFLSIAVLFSALLQLGVLAKGKPGHMVVPSHHQQQHEQSGEDNNNGQDTVEKAMQALFTSWMREFNKSYDQKEFRTRYATWKANYMYIEAFNKREGNTFTLGMNQFGDLSVEEFRGLYMGYRNLVPREPYHGAVLHPELPPSVDWRTKGVVTGIKDQGQCGSCWAFSATGSLEGAHAFNTGKLVSLSEQNLVDCSTNQGNMGCNGGLMDYAFKYVIANEGLDTEASYPYHASDGTCVYNKANCGTMLKAYQDVPSESEPALQTAIANVGPVSVAIDASHSSFQFYKSGVYYEPGCSSVRLDHGVLAVGYDTSSNGGDYYIVKNSWGASWGNQGYIWMSRNRNNNCGIATAASYPLKDGATAC